MMMMQHIILRCILARTSLPRMVVRYTMYHHHLGTCIHVLRPPGMAHTHSCYSTDHTTNTTVADTSTEGKFQIVFTCKVCQTRCTKQFTKVAYYRGVVLVKCPGCFNLHLIADNLGWFGERSNIETILKEKGESVKVIDGNIEVRPEELVGKDKIGQN